MEHTYLVMETFIKGNLKWDLNMGMGNTRMQKEDSILDNTKMTNIMGTDTKGGLMGLNILEIMRTMSNLEKGLLYKTDNYSKTRSKMARF